MHDSLATGTESKSTQSDIRKFVGINTSFQKDA